MASDLEHKSLLATVSKSADHIYCSSYQCSLSFSTSLAICRRSSKYTNDLSRSVILQLVPLFSDGEVLNLLFKNSCHRKMSEWRASRDRRIMDLITLHPLPHPTPQRNCVWAMIPYNIPIFSTHNGFGSVSTARSWLSKKVRIQEIHRKKRVKFWWLYVMAR